MLRLDTEANFTNAASWSAFDVSAIGVDTGGYGVYTAEGKRFDDAGADLGRTR